MKYLLQCLVTTSVVNIVVCLLIYLANIYWAFNMYQTLPGLGNKDVKEDSLPLIAYTGAWQKSVSSIWCIKCHWGSEERLWRSGYHFWEWVVNKNEFKTQSLEGRKWHFSLRKPHIVFMRFTFTFKVYNFHECSNFSLFTEGGNRNLQAGVMGSRLNV